MKNKTMFLFVFLLLIAALSIVGTADMASAAFNSTDLYVSDKDSDNFLAVDTGDNSQQLIGSLPAEC